MNADDIIKIIEKLPEYIKLVYPGYITIYLFYFFRAITIKDNKAIILKAVILSYIYNVLIDETCTLFFIKGNLGYVFVENILLMILSIIIAYLSYSLTRSKKVRTILEKFNIYTTFSSNEIDEMECQSTNGTWIVVYLKDSDIVYEGFIVNKEMEPDKDRYIALAMYRKYTIDTNGKPVTPYIDDYSKNCNEKVVIYYRQIALFEVRDTDCNEESETDM